RAIVVMTRWHHDDVVGRIERGEAGPGWRVVNLPAIAGEGDALGRVPGEALWPERWPADLLRVRAQRVGSVVWEALYQGRPSPAEGRLFRKADFRYVERNGDFLTAAPELGLPVARVSDSIVFQTVDMATTLKTSGDWTVICTWAAPN